MTFSLPPDPHGHTVRAILQGGKMDGHQMAVPADLDIIWVGPVQAGWSGELDDPPASLIGTDVVGYRLADVREDGVHVFSLIEGMAGRGQGS